jgi:phosphopantetheine adenylyltransferase
MYLSSSTVKELGSYDVDLSDFLPEQIIPDFKERIRLLSQGGNSK